MKLAISPIYVFTSIIGLGFLSLSDRANPGYGFLGDGIIFLGFSIFTLSLTYMHAAGEAKRNISMSRKWIRVVYRGLILLFIAFISYRFELQNNLTSGLLSIGNLALNQAFLFGISFDLWYNKFRGNDWDYHGNNSKYDLIARKNPEAFLIAESIFYIITSGLVCFEIFFS